ncbi:putative AN1-like zinc finger domain-containing protein [Hamiltosporidium magnivora]|uniref:Putative AN1-like zinc finger domain-containing protein n=1 Tax=Hamiltosporidium magnivora TaxID=148818 RepID=A0A4Q9LHI3_9MICR|nr:putative AN1-like zinc finger domain-containing protein [Hamiltosporidium magnivora]
MIRAFHTSTTSLQVLQSIGYSFIKKNISNTKKDNMGEINVSDGRKEISINIKEYRKVSDLTKYVAMKMNISEFWLEYNGLRLKENSPISEIKFDQTTKISVIYKKLHCFFKQCYNKAGKINSDCNYCSKNYCAKHRIPESHACIEIESCKKAANSRNEAKLLKEKLTRNKI